MEFGTYTRPNCGANCTLELKQLTVKDSPFGELSKEFDDNHPLKAKSQLFKNAVLDAISTPGEKLLANTISELGV